MFFLGIALVLVGGSIVPAVIVTTSEPPKPDGSVIIDRWATFKALFPGNVIAVTGVLLTVTSASYLLWKSFQEGYVAGKRPTSHRTE